MIHACLVAVLASVIALYSGFGLGTLPLPVFAIFFPIPVAVAATAVVHLANNLFRLGLVGRHADRTVILLFGLPAAATAILGALPLVTVSMIPPLATYTLGGREFSISVVKLMIALLIAGFAVLELSPLLSDWKVERKFLPVGACSQAFLEACLASRVRCAHFSWQRLDWMPLASSALRRWSPSWSTWHG